MAENLLKLSQMFLISKAVMSPKKQTFPHIPKASEVFISIETVSFPLGAVTFVSVPAPFHSTSDCSCSCFFFFSWKLKYELPCPAQCCPLVLKPLMWFFPPIHIRVLILFALTSHIWKPELSMNKTKQLRADFAILFSELASNLLAHKHIYKSISVSKACLKTTNALPSCFFFF